MSLRPARLAVAARFGQESVSAVTLLRRALRLDVVADYAALERHTESGAAGRTQPAQRAYSTAQSLPSSAVSRVPDSHPTRVHPRRPPWPRTSPWPA